MFLLNSTSRWKCKASQTCFRILYRSPNARFGSVSYLCAGI